MKSAKVNIWQLITTLSGRDLPDSDKCEDIEILAGSAGGFGHQASLEVDQFGTWTFTFFSCYGGEEVSLRVTKRGDVSVSRTLSTNVTEVRTVSF